MKGAGCFLRIIMHDRNITHTATNEIIAIPIQMIRKDILLCVTSQVPSNGPFWESYGPLPVRVNVLMTNVVTTLNDAVSYVWLYYLLVAAAYIR